VTIVLAHLSDTHFDTGSRSGGRGQQVMDYLNGLPGHLDAIIVTGDITDHGLPAEHEQAAKILTSTKAPVYTCPGNHDGYTPYDGPLNVRVDLGTVRLLLADSVLQGKDEGELGTPTLQWLASELAASSVPVLIGFHHPPVDLYQPFIDRIKLRNAGALAALIEQHDHVLAVLCGHAHMAAASTFAGLPVLVAPGVTSTVLLPWETTDSNVIDYGQPPALAFHIIDDHGRITTHYRTVHSDAS
jgi:3',5'-cyclic AMP phosphodiesterase CpdA